MELRRQDIGLPSWEVETMWDNSNTHMLMVWEIANAAGTKSGGCTAETLGERAKERRPATRDGDPDAAQRLDPWHRACRGQR